MDQRILKWLYDIKISINEIESYFDQNLYVFSEYRENIMLKRAIERNLEIIGEALNRIVKRDKQFEILISESKSIIGLRNHIIHAYDNISDQIVWSILIQHLPKLKKETIELIDKNQK